MLEGYSNPYFAKISMKNKRALAIWIDNLELYKNRRNWNPVHCWWGCKMAQPLWETA